MADNEPQGRVVADLNSTALVGSEFAEVAISIDGQGNGPRLRLEDLRSGRVRFLDALEIETIIWLPEGHLRQLLDPASDRWREDV